jgi:hypothetical protein
MEGRETPHTEKHKEVMNDWNYDSNCTLTLLPVSDLENFKLSIFLAQCIQSGLRSTELSSWKCLLKLSAYFSENWVLSFLKQSLHYVCEEMFIGIWYHSNCGNNYYSLVLLSRVFALHDAKRKSNFRCTKLI